MTGAWLHLHDFKVIPAISGFLGFSAVFSVRIVTTLAPSKFTWDTLVACYLRLAFALVRDHCQYSVTLVVQSIFSCSAYHFIRTLQAFVSNLYFHPAYSTANIGDDASLSSSSCMALSFLTVRELNFIGCHFFSLVLRDSSTQMNLGKHLWNTLHCIRSVHWCYYLKIGFDSCGDNRALRYSVFCKYQSTLDLLPWYGFFGLR